MTTDEALRWLAANEATVLHWKGRVEVLAHCARGQGKGLVEAVEKCKAVIEKRKAKRNETKRRNNGTSPAGTAQAASVLHAEP